MFDDIRKQLKTCRKKHQGCGVGTEKPLTAPKRLLKLDASNERCYLIETTRNCRLQYAALSYCWGTTQTMLTRNTLSKLESGVHPSHFSRTIQDAIKVVVNLGLQYLWVDALCIIQDDDKDKADEIRHMGDIYYGASFTIAASNAASNQDGFLMGRLSNVFPVTLVHGKLGRTTPLMMIQDPAQTELVHPLHTRAWTLQEGIFPTPGNTTGANPSPAIAYFSRRYIHFGISSVTVLCHETSLDLSGFSSKRDLDTIFRWGRGTHFNDYPGFNPNTFWKSVVEKYSSRGLTIPSDKLIALSALVKDVAIHVASEDPRPQNYLAGLWRKTLVYELTWTMADSPRQRPASYRAPSWSWASVDGRVHAADVESVMLAEHNVMEGVKKVDIIRAETTWDVSVGPFSAVTGGFIVVEGLISEISDYEYDATCGKESIKFYGEFWTLDALEPEIARPRHERLSVWVLQCQEQIGEHSGEGYGEVEFHGDFFGLILLEVPDEQSFRRIGCVSFLDWSGENEKFWELRKKIWGESTRKKVRII